MIYKRLIFWTILILLSLGISGCSETSSTLGQFHQGRILILNVFEMERSEELRYSTIDTEDVVRKWRIQPSDEGQELLLMRLRIENHVALNTVLVADQQAVVLEGFFQDEFRPISVSETVFLDKRGQGNPKIDLYGGECTDHPRVIVNAGATVQWANVGGTRSSIQFDSGVVAGLGKDVVEIVPGGTVSTKFEQAGTFRYLCGDGDELAQILVEDSNSIRGQRENNILFLEGSFNLPKDTSLDGWMIFDIPKGTEIKSLRWRAGDSITIRF